MRANRVHSAMVAALCGCLLFGLAPAAVAFFPYGLFDDETGQFNLVKWELSDMDTNGDQRVDPGEGVEVFFETGEFGWTDEEIETLKEAFAVWESIPTCYMAWREGGRISDPVEVSGEIDGFNTIAIDMEGDTFTAGVGGGILGLTTLTFYVEDTVTFDGQQYLVPTYKLIDVDVAFDEQSVRQQQPGVEPTIDLLAVAVHEFGHFLGLGHNPMNNLENIGTADAPEYIESLVFAQRDAEGRLQRVGTTPTMFNNPFDADDGAGGLEVGTITLAPDDIAGASFLYPRGNQDMFFSIYGEARTRNATGLPSIPLAGGLVTAWCDVDDNPDTPRIPLVSTMTSLYVAGDDDVIRGRFQLPGLLKEIEVFGLPNPVRASYTLTLSPINARGVEFLAPTPYTPTDYDYTHTVFGSAPTFAFDTVFQSEVFHEAGNLFGLDHVDVGTPLEYDPARRKVVSAISEQTLDRLLAGFRPMFGDAPPCPYTVVSAGLKTNNGANALRSFRDGFLLKTAVGAAFVNAYYQAGPAVSSFLLERPLLFTAAHWTVALFEWSLTHLRLVLVAMLALALLAAARRGRRLRPAFAALLIALGLCLLALPAGALIEFINEHDMAQRAEHIIEGTVSNVDTQLLDEGGRVITDTTITVTRVLKGRLNVGSPIYLRMPGGRAGGVVTLASEMPAFKQGEEVLLYLITDRDGALKVLAGKRGKYEVLTDAKTGEKFIRAGSDAAAFALKHAEKSMKDPDPSDGRIPLEIYREYIRENLKSDESDGSKAEDD